MLTSLADLKFAISISFCWTASTAASPEATSTSNSTSVCPAIVASGAFSFRCALIAFA